MQYLFLDVEASGLFDYTKAADAPGQPRLAQIGMIFVDSDHMARSKHEFLIKPRGWTMSPEATAVTGLTTEYLEEHGGPVEEALDLYSRAIEARHVVVGFNVKTYDLKVMRAELRHAGKPDLFMQTRSLCVMQGCRHLVGAKNVKGHSKAPTLKEACAYFEIEQPAAHSALADALSSYSIMMKLLALGQMPDVDDPYNKKPKAAKRPRRKTGEKHATTSDTFEEGDETGIPE